jgi:DNA-binding transcriptional ArsR family regulator
VDSAEWINGRSNLFGFGCSAEALKARVQTRRAHCPRSPAWADPGSPCGRDQRAVARRQTPAASVLVVGLLHRSRSVPKSCARHLSALIYNQMVVDQASDAGVDRIFHALADGTRRDILALAVGGRYSVSALAKRYPMSFAAVQKHVAVLEGAGLITKERRGRERLVRTDVDTVQRARVLLDGIEELWRARVNRIDDLLATEKRTPGGKR